MSTEDNTNIITPDIYMASRFVEKLKSKYINIPEDTLYLGIYGYLSSIFTNLIQNTATIAADYAAEASPTKAKFEKNIISHALSLGLNNIFANPAEVDILLCFLEDSLKTNMSTNSESKNEIIIDRDAIFYIGNNNNYPYILDYDLKIKKILLPSGNDEYTYTATYVMDKYNKNPLSNLKNPYLPAVGKFVINNNSLVAIKVTLRQLSHSIITKNIIVNNPFETKTVTFEFEDQLAYFYVEVNEQSKDNLNGTEYHYLKPVYEGIYDYSSDENEEIINYIFIDEKTIRLKFNRNSYQPKRNCEVILHIFTTLGEECNFSFAENYQSIQNLTSNNYVYNSLTYILRSISDSQYGRDKYSVEKLKQFIPKEAFSRGSITTYTDLNNYFNTIQTEDCKLYLLRKIHNQIDRLYFCYLLLRHEGDIVPTNTVNISFTRNDFDLVTKFNFIINPGKALFKAFKNDDALKTITLYDKENDIIKYEKQGFLYTNPLMIVINKNPFYVSYFNINVNYTRDLYFEYINENSQIQFIASQIKVYKNFENNKNNEFHIEIEFARNINTDYDLISFTSDGEIDKCYISVYAALYYEDEEKKSDVPFRYIEGTIKNYDLSGGSYIFDFCLTTNHKIANKNTYMYFNTGLKEPSTGIEFPTYLYKNMKVKFFFMVKLDIEYGRIYTQRNGEMQNIDNFFPNMDGYTLTNIYNTDDEGIDFYYDYSDIMNSYIELTRDTDNDMIFTIHKVPLIRYSWLYNANDTEKRIKDFLKIIELRRRYIQNAIVLLEDSFGIDFKFYNTYGSSTMYNIDNTTNIDRVNLSLKFEIKFKTKEDLVMLPAIKSSIKDYIEDINNTDDLHMPNLITYIKNKYDDNLVYIKFIKLNNYPSLWQSIYKNPIIDENYFLETQTVPEFINIHNISTGNPDIQFDIIS